MSEYILPPGSTFEPGDVFVDVPFPNLRHPFKRYRLNPKPQDKGKPEIFLSADGPDKPGDIIHSTFERKQVMLLSHGCELDKVLKLGANAARRHWLCAPVEPFDTTTSDERLKARQQRIRNGVQWNRLYIPENEFLKPGEFTVDLRRITPLPAQFFIEAKKCCRLGEEALFDLYAQLGVSISGLLLYVQPIKCAKCGTNVDPRQFQIPSPEDAEEDRD